MCGGTADALTVRPTNPGLSPRVRGNPITTSGLASASRSIPACAGEPYINPRTGEREEVYPRVCGGTWPGRRRASCEKGLSPRVRGNLSAHLAHRLGTRSIPACAGEPMRREGLRLMKQVYPRVCGGTRGGRCGCCGLPGLSPRVRGNHMTLLDAGENVRSIPACAGEPGATIPICRRKRVYPRVCGGTLRCEKKTAVTPGLSPRVRGNPCVPAICDH